MKRFNTFSLWIVWALLSGLSFGEDEMVLIPEGSFSMGSETGAYDESPVHRVQLPAYWIDRCEVTNSEFVEFVRETKSVRAVEGTWFRYSAEGCVLVCSYYEDEYGTLGAEDVLQADRVRWSAALRFLGQMADFSVADLNARSVKAFQEEAMVQATIEAQRDYPVRGVTWRDANRYAAWKGKRLPTEAEWERAAKGETGALYPWGDEWKPYNTENVHPVAGYSEFSNSYGCFGMAGNVWEWTSDWYGESYYSSDAASGPNPYGPVGLSEGGLPEAYSQDAFLRSSEQGREENTRKVIRGGGFGGPEAQARFNFRTTRRLWCNPNYWHADIGFRCAKDF